MDVLAAKIFWEIQRFTGMRTTLRTRPAMKA
jgi:hypothetical protein